VVWVGCLGKGGHLQGMVEPPRSTPQRVRHAAAPDVGRAAAAAGRGKPQRASRAVADDVGAAGQLAHLRIAVSESPPPPSPLLSRSPSFSQKYKTIPFLPPSLILTL
jgi:hypothetical protein